MLWIGAATQVAAPLAWAHPGRTKSNGCHTCRTNCSSWGLANGEYHCHGGDSAVKTPRAGQDPPHLKPPPPAEGTIHIEPSKGLQAKVGLQVDGMAVVDGETFVARQRGKLYLLRLRDIEAPELEEPYGPEARDRLASLVVGRKLLIQAEKGEGCVIAVRAKTLEGEDIARRLISAGLVRVSPESPDALRRLEQRAQGEKKGLWSGSRSTVPEKL